MKTEKPPAVAKADKLSPPKKVERRRGRLFRAAPRHPRLIAEFQSDAIEVEQRSPPRFARLTLYCVLALILAAVTWASVSQVDMIVTAQGKLITMRPNLVVQPLETSVIREIHVRAGDRVNRGDLLATLDPTFSQADHDQLRNRVAAFDASIARLRAELAGSDYVAADLGDADAVLQRNMFLQRKSARDAQMQNFDAQIASAQANLKTAQNEEAVLVQRLDNMRSIESMRSTLMDKEVGSKLNFLLSRDARLDVESNLARVRGNIADYAHRVDKARADQKVFAEDFRQTAYQDLVETLTKRDSASEELKKVELAAAADRAKGAGRRHRAGDRQPHDRFGRARGRNAFCACSARCTASGGGQRRGQGCRADIGRPAGADQVRAFPVPEIRDGNGTVRVISQDLIFA